MFIKIDILRDSYSHRDCACSALLCVTAGAASTFTRFVPKVKARYDYGVLIFILTFSFMAISGYRVDNLFEVAYRRLATIIIGCIICMLISLLICPIWAGEDLHKLITCNMEGLAESLEGKQISMLPARNQVSHVFES